VSGRHHHPLPLAIADAFTRLQSMVFGLLCHAGPPMVDAHLVLSDSATTAPGRGQTRVWCAGTSRLFRAGGIPAHEGLASHVEVSLGRQPVRTAAKRRQRDDRAVTRKPPYVKAVDKRG
jgi:hypothetical protein